MNVCEKLRRALEVSYFVGLCSLFYAAAVAIPRVANKLSSLDFGVTIGY